MTFPTLNRVILDLHTLADSTVAQELLSELEGLELTEVSLRENFTNRLRELLKNQPEESLIKKSAYRLLIIFGKRYPLNQCEDEQPIDPILFVFIEEADLFISVDGYQWSIPSLAQHCRVINAYKNPVTAQPFTPEDIHKMKKIAAKVGVSIEIQEREQETNAGNLQARRAVSSACFGGFYHVLSAAIQNSAAFGQFLPFVPKV